MKIFKLVTIFASLSLCSTLAHADIVLGSAGEDVCSKLPGTWEGKGHVSALSGVVNCEYRGNGVVTADTQPGNYSVHVVLKPESGICPPEDMVLAGTCSNGMIVLHRDDADLTGSMDAEGKTADVKGQVRFEVDIPIVGKKTVTANVTNLHLTKQN